MEDDGEIEYLDEDEDLVQQYVQKPVPLQTPVIHSVQSLAGEDLEEQIAPLLVERKPLEKRKYKTDDDDSDYDPNEDLAALAVQRKKRKVVHKKVFTRPPIAQVSVNQIKSEKNSLILNRKYESKLKNLPNLTVQKKQVGKVETPRAIAKKVVKKVDNVNERKKLDIRIPDFEDPLCLPVRAIQRDEHDVRKLKVWNNLCLEHYRKADVMFRPQRGDAVSSLRTVVLRNVKNKHTGKIDTSVYGKVTVENKWGEKRSETFQGTLPKYREKKVLTSYPLQLGSQRSYKHICEALLTKEENKDGDSLVVYKPREAVSAVYKFIEKSGQEEDTEDSAREEKRVSREVACCKLCAPCYQASWRGTNKKKEQVDLACSVCNRTFVSVYNLLTHLNTNHTGKEVSKHRSALAKTLAQVVEYHYRCRICQQLFTSIKLLRKHVTKHQEIVPQYSETVARHSEAVLIY